MDIPDGYAPIVDALLKGLDPRLTESERTDELMIAAEAPAFVLGVLSEIILSYHSEAERLSGKPPGTFVDALRRKAFGTLDPQDVIGYAITADDRFTLTPKGARATQGDTPEDTQRDDRPAPDRPIAEVARAAEAARRARLEQSMTGTGQGESYPGGAVRREHEGRFVYQDDGGFSVSTGDGQIHEFPPQPATEPAALAVLRDNLARQRSNEAAIDAADLDDPQSARRALAASDRQVAETPDEVPAPVLHMPGVPRSFVPATTSASNGSNTPAQCGYLTAQGPCGLRVGHPEMPVLGTENGHIYTGGRS